MTGASKTADDGSGRDLARTPGLASLEALFQHAPGSVIVIDAETRIVALNQSAESLFGLVADDTIGGPVSRLFNDPREFERIQRSRLSEAAPLDDAPFVTRYRASGGKVFDGETVIAPDGEPGGGHVLVIRDVTEQLSLRGRLEASEVQLRAALSSARQGAYGFNLDTGLGSVRGFICEFMGLDKADATMSLERWREHVHADCIAGHDAWLDQLRADPAHSHDFVYRAQRADGELRWLENRGRVAETDRNGAAKRIAGVISDITERKEMEDRLAESERLLREGMESAGQGAWSVDYSSGELTVSGILVDIHGRKTGSNVLTMEDWLAPLSPESRELARSATEQLRRGEELVHEYEVAGPDGHWIWLLSRGRPIEWDENGRLLRATGVVTDITETKRLEALADERAVRLREALDAAGEGAWTFDLRTGVGQITPVISEMMGLGDSDATTTIEDWAERIHPDDAEAARAALKDLREDRVDTLHHTIRYNHASKGWIQLLNRGRVSRRDSSGQATTATGFMTDVTERVETAQLLDERERQLEDALNAASLSVWRVDVPKRELTVEGPVAELIGVDETSNKITIESWADYVHPDDREAEQATAQAMVQAGGERREVVYRLRAQNGDWLWHRAIGRVMRRDSDGAPLLASGILQDVHEWKRLNDLVEAEKRRFEMIYRSTPAMLHTIDADRRIIEVSDYWLTYLGYERDEVIGRDAVSFLDEESRSRLSQQTVEDPKLTRTLDQIPMRMRKKSGEHIDVLLSAFGATNAQGEPIRYGVMTDVSALREAYTQLERSNRELDRFATVASHDLQEPLRKIAAFAGLLNRRYADALDEEGVNCLEFLVDAAARMQKLIDDLLSYSRMASRPLERRAADLGEIVAEACDMLEATIEEAGATVETGELPQIVADRAQILHLLQNLISNAVKYRGEAPPVVRISAETDAAGCTICVADNGIGLDPRFSDKIFAPFQRLHTREEFPGTGIGLAIVQQAAERHGGKVWVESAPGEGARFYVYIPEHPAGD